MSSTNRGNDRSAHDYYVTPIPAIIHFIQEFHADNEWFGPSYIVDPCAGGDASNPMSYPSAFRLLGYTPLRFNTIDIRGDSPATITCDYLKCDVGSSKPDLIISNPPFNLAMEFIQKALEDVREGGLVIMLLRLNYFGSQKRKAWWQANMPTWCYVHSERMSFTPDGKTDSIEYMHAVWVKGQHPKFTQLRVI
jgi:hypothetical protein